MGEVPSKVFSDFRDDFIKLRGQHKFINKLTFPKLQLPPTVDDPGETFRREAQFAIYGGAFISFILKWEAFVQDFLEETFLKLIELITSGLQPPEEAEKLLEHVFKEWHTQQKKSKTPQQLSFQLVLEPDKWKKVLEDYAKKVCKECHVTPVFHGNKGITNCLKKLFMIDVKLAKKMLESRPIKFQCIINGPPSPSDLTLGNADALENVTRLLYGVRCVLAHSKHERTFDSDALSHFPDQSVFLEQMGGSNPASNQFYSFYTRAEAVYKKELDCLQIYYCDIVNLQRFIMQMVIRLHNTVVTLIKDHYGLPVWKMVPDIYG